MTTLKTDLRPTRESARRIRAESSTGAAAGKTDVQTALEGIPSFSGLFPLTIGDLLYASGPTTLSRLAAGTSGYALLANGAGVAPSYQGFLQTGTGAIARTWLEKSRDVLNAADFGVTANGSTDDTAACALAITAAAAQKKFLIWPAGVIKVSSALTLPTNSASRGQGTGQTVFSTTSASGTVFIVSGNNVTMEGFGVASSATRTSSSVCFNVTGINTILRDITTTQMGITAQTNTNTPLNPIFLFDNLQTNDTVQNGVDVDIAACFIGTLANCTFSGDSVNRSTASVRISSCDQLQIYNCSLLGPDIGLLVSPGNGQSVGLIKASLSYIDSCATAGIACLPSGTGTCANITWQNGYIASAGNLVLLSGNGSNITDVNILNNTMRGNGVSTNNGIYAVGATSVNVQGNQFWFFNAYAVALDGTVGADISGNVMVGSIGTGVGLLNATDYADVHHNDLRGATTKLSDIASGTHNTTGPNRGRNPISFPAAFAGILRLTADTDVTFPVAGTLATRAGAEALTNKTYNGNTWTAGTGTLTLGAGKTAAINNTLTLSGTDGSSAAFGTGGTVAYQGGTLAQFAATTSTQLAGVMSDETGSGALVFGTAPAITGIIGGKASFRANKNGTDQSGIADGTLTKVTFTTEVFDAGSFYDNTNSKWTPPAGKVLLSVALTLSNATTMAAGNGFIAYIYKNGSILAQFSTTVSAASTFQGAGGNIVEDASGTDFYEVYVFIDTASGTGTLLGTAIHTFFSGTYLGP